MKRSGRIVIASVAITALIFAAAGAAALLGALRVPDAFASGPSPLASCSSWAAAAAFAILQGAPPGPRPCGARRGNRVRVWRGGRLDLADGSRIAAIRIQALGRLVAEKSSPSVALGSIGAHTRSSITLIAR